MLFDALQAGDGTSSRTQRGKIARSLSMTSRAFAFCSLVVLLSSLRTHDSFVAGLAPTSPPSRIFGDTAQFDVPFDSNYFHTACHHKCHPKYVDAKGKNKSASLGFPGACPRTLPWNDSRIAAPPPSPSPRECTPGQAKLKWWGTRHGTPSMLVSWTMCPEQYVTPSNSSSSHSSSSSSTVKALDVKSAPSTIRIGREKGKYDHKVTDVTSFSYTNDFTTRFNLTGPLPAPPATPPTVRAKSSENGGTYVSPIINHALIKDLEPGETIHYRIEGGPPGNKNSSFEGHFKVPGGFPLRLGLLSDPGQTHNTTVSLEFLMAGGGDAGNNTMPDLVIASGDISYADNNEDWNMFYDWDMARNLTDNVQTFGPRWDSSGRLLSPLGSSVPIMTCPGNHEIEQTPKNGKYPAAANFSNNVFLTRFSNYLARYPSPVTKQQALHGPSVADLEAITPSDSDQGRGLYYATVVPGALTLISLSTYNFDDHYTTDDKQYKWLEQELAAVNRSNTPWVIVQKHISFYSTSLKHGYEAECMRQLYEPLYRKYGVDIVISGHDHQYERSAPVFDYKLDPDCGTVYLVTAYAGDELNFPWIDKYRDYLADNGLLKYYGSEGLNKAKTCVNATVAPNGGGYAYENKDQVPQQRGQWGANGTCVTKKVEASGSWCPQDGQPEFSRFRQNSDGAGFLDLLSPTEALWSFFSHSSDLKKPEDQVIITRGNPKCAGSGGANVTMSTTEAKGGAMEANKP